MEEVGSTVKREYCHEENDEDLRKAVREACYDKAYAIAASGNRNKHERQDAFDAIRDEFKTQYTDEELEEKGVSCDLEEIKKDIKERDERDCTRKIAPLRQAEDAVLIDSSDMTIEEVVKAITDNIV